MILKTFVLVFEGKNGIEEKDGNGDCLVVKRKRERDKVVVIKEVAMESKKCK